MKHDVIVKKFLKEELKGVTINDFYNKVEEYSSFANFSFYFYEMYQKHLIKEYDVRLSKQHLQRELSKYKRGTFDEWDVVIREDIEQYRSYNPNQKSQTGSSLVTYTVLDLYDLDIHFITSMNGLREMLGDRPFISRTKKVHVYRGRYIILHPSIEFDSIEDVSEFILSVMKVYRRRLNVS